MGALTKECGRHLAVRGLCLREISILCLSALILVGAQMILSWVFKARRLHLVEVGNWAGFRVFKEIGGFSSDGASAAAVGGGALRLT